MGTGWFLWALLPVALLGRPRWALLAWVLLANVDFSGSGFATTTDVGWENAIKGLVIPSILLLRFRPAIPKGLLVTLWITFCAYVGLATLWSPFPLSAIKFLGNLVGLSLMAWLLFTVGDELDWKLVGLAGISTAFFGLIGGAEGIRFTTLVSPQSFAAFMAGLFIYFLWFGKAWLAPLFGALVIAAGSRTFFIVVVIVGLFWWMHNTVGSGIRIAYSSLALFVGGLILFVGLNSNLDLPQAWSSNRIFASYQAARGEPVPENVELETGTVGTVSFRQRMYSLVTASHLQGSWNQRLFGFGTSAGGEVLERYFYTPGFIGSNLDANRAVHNEWLRILFEFGFVGLALWAAFYTALTWKVFLLLRTRQNEAYALLSVWVALSIGLVTENVLASAGSALALGLGIVFGRAASCLRESDYLSRHNAFIHERPAGAFS